MGRNLRLVRRGAADATDVQSLVASVTRGCKTDREKMIALWAYIARSGYYHWCEARENPEGPTELGVVYDPIAALNVHGTVICYQVADLLANLAEAAGIATRTRGVPGHKVMEAFYDGRWHLFDATYDCAAYYVADDGKTVVSLAELCKDAGKYIRKPRHPSRPFFPFDRYGGKFWPWESKEYVIKHFYPPAVATTALIFAPYIARGHTIHIDLRRGEKLVRNFTHEGMWYCPPDFHAKWTRDLTQRWVDDGPHDPRNPTNTYANGALIYEPDWNVESNFLDGLHEGKDFVLAGGMVRPAGDAEASVVFRIQSPYLIVGRPGRLDVAGDSRDGAVFQADFFRRNADAANVVAVSWDNGITWQEVWRNDRTGRRTVRLDLTPHVEGTYGYQIKVTLRGRRGEDAALAKLRLRNHLFLSPIPLPAVQSGRNEFRFRLEEGRGVHVIRPDLGRKRGYERFFHELKGLEYSPKFTGHLSPVRRRGHAVIEVAPGGGAKVQWLTVHGSFAAAVGAAKAESAEILYATEPAGPWQRAWKSDFSARNDKWRWDHSVDIRLPRPAEKCYVKFLLTRRKRMSLNAVRIYAHTVRPSRRLPAGSVAVTHAWTENGKDRRRTVRPKLPRHTYAVVAGGKDVTNRSVTIEVANDR